VRGEEVLHELIFIRNPQQPAGVWISVSSRPVRDQAGTIHGGVAVFRDVTEAQSVLSPSSVEAASTGTVQPPARGREWEIWLERLHRLRQFNDRLSRAIEQTADSVIITDRRGVIEYVNPALEATTGYAASEVLGKTPRILKSGHHDHKFYQNLWSRILAGESFQGTIVNRKKSGELYWAEQTITPIKDQNQQITHFVSVLKDVTELRKQQEQEFHLQFAREVQQRFYSGTVSVPGFDIAGTACPAALTGGDYFDFIPQPDGRICIAIGDVSGHGFGSALVMAGARAYTRVYAQSEPDLCSILKCVNRALVADLDGPRYVTLLLVRLDPAKRFFEYAGAGHVPCYLLRRSGEIGLVMESTSPPLGFFPEHEFSSSPVIPLEEQDTLVLLTDGITEAVNADRVEFGAGRALELIRSHPQHTARELVQAICDAVRSFAGSEPQRDDITSVICKVNPVSR
jgi:sigma-B regulation protein RsbU (phosphoserine phosphatase)